jgi:membrane-associated protease RseP (regulator of RpoE activity)
MLVFELFTLVAALMWGTLFVYELGHLVTARYFGVGVVTISVGVGPAIVKFIDGRGTLWSVGLIPLGSRLKMVDEEVSSPHGLARAQEVIGWGSASLSSRSRVQRAVIYCAGAAANILQAPAIYALGQRLFVGASASPDGADPASVLVLTFGLYSLALGLLNLLPLPTLDGGKLMRLGIEWFWGDSVQSARRAGHLVKFRTVGHRWSFSSLDLRSDKREFAGAQKTHFHASAGSIEKIDSLWRVAGA